MKKSKSNRSRIFCPDRMRLQEQFWFLFLKKQTNKTTPKPRNNTTKQIHMETHWPAIQATEQFYLLLSQLNFSSQRTSELHSSQQLTFTAARVKLGQLGKEKISQYHCQRKRKRPRDTVSVKGAPVKRPERWVHLQSKQRELHSAGTEAARAFHQLSCVTAMAWTSNTHRDS